MKRTGPLQITKALKKIGITGLCLSIVTVGLFVIHIENNSASSMYFSEELLDRVSSKYGEYASRRLNSLAQLIDKNATIDDIEKVKLVNDFFNQVPYYSDIQHWKQKDYWATPIEKLATNGGDCEDYSIAKYYTLRELGIEEKKLRIMYVKALEWNEAHMVLTYFPEPSFSPLVLDNIKPGLKTADQRKDLIPVYSFNANGLYLAKAQGTGKRVGGPEKLKLWTNMMKKMDGSDI